MSDEGLDLRSLLDVAEPDVVRTALHRFRRRLLTRYLWLSSALLIAAGAVVWGLQPATLEQKIRSATAREVPRVVWHLDGVTIGLAEVVPLKDSVGLHFVLVPTRGDANDHTYRLRTEGGIDEQSDSNGFDTYMQVPRTTDGRYEVTVTDASDSALPQETFVLDLAELRVSGSWWKET